MPLTSFCGLLTLQVGVAVLAAVFFALAGAILAANVFDYYNAYGGWPLNLILLIIFVVGLILAGIIMFSSSYSESRTMALSAMILVIILLCYWLVLSCFSFASDPDHLNNICIHSRCPESFWLANLGYRNNSTYNKETVEEDVYYDDPEDEDDDDSQDKDESSVVHNFAFVGAIILFIINLLFLLFTIFTMWSWASELDWADYYIEDEPVVVIDDY